jgi:hypothetical protein
LLIVTALKPNRGAGTTSRLNDCPKPGHGWRCFGPGWPPENCWRFDLSTLSSCFQQYTADYSDRLTSGVRFLRTAGHPETTAQTIWGPFGVTSIFIGWRFGFEPIVAILLRFDVFNMA